jgi:DNA-binding transcriptional LysR family regulator
MLKKGDVMTIRHLKIFIEVVDSGKMSTAAEKLYISQPTVSQAIKELEEHYGGLLFERLSKKLYITEMGEKLLSYARNVVKMFDDMEEAMLQDAYLKRIRIGATHTVGDCLLGDVINALREINPNTEIYSYVSNTKNIEEKLLRSELDIGIVEGSVKSPDLISIPELNDFLVLICSTKHPFAKRNMVKLEELKSESFAMREEGSGTRELFERYMQEKGMPIRIALEGNSSDAIKKSVIENGFLAVISVRLVEEEVKNGQIHVITNEDKGWDRFFSVVYHKNKVMTEEMKNLIGIVDHYKNVDVLEGISTGRLIK